MSYIINSDTYTSIETSIKLNEIYNTDHLTKCYFKYFINKTETWSLDIPTLTNIEEETGAWSCGDMLKLMEPIETGGTRFIFNMIFAHDKIYVSYDDIYNSSYSLIKVTGVDLPEILAEILIKIQQYI